MPGTDERQNAFLKEYRAKRHFSETPEPVPRRESRQARHGGRDGLHYVIQKHDASRLHYDFRLELDGALKSWAVPKGPSLDPSRKVLAVQVEDHPLSYEEFEGVIPEGQYGGGTVMLWDRGTWEPLDDPHAGFAKGHLRFALHGGKLHGNWSLVQMHGSAGANGKNWLLIKARDEFSGTRDILAEEPASVKSRRSLEEIAGTKDAVWQSNRGGAADSDGVHKANGHRRTAKGRSVRAAGASREPMENRGTKAAMPDRIAPQLAVLAEHPPEGDEWVHEIKFDGYRLLAFLKDGGLTLRTRAGKDWTAKFLPLHTGIKKLAARTAILDGEAEVLNEKGQSDFQLLQSSFKGAAADLHYYAFDLLYLDGRDLRQLPLLERKALLKDLLERSRSLPRMEYSDHVRGNGAKVLQKACELGSEGIVSKRADAAYVARRDPTWRKSKCGKGQEFVIVGYTRSSKRSGLRSLLLGYFEGQDLIYCGRVGTGFDEKMRHDLLAKLEKIERAEPALAKAPSRREQKTGRWVKPDMVCEVHFEGWTRDGSLRHPAFVSLRLDKPAREIHREMPVKVAGEGETTMQRTKAPLKTPRRARAGNHPASGDGDSDDAGVYTDSEKPARWGGVRMTHPDKVLYPGEGSAITKSDVADYYALAMPWMLPHVVDRPLALLRCPDGLAPGASRQCFFMRNWSATLPREVGKVAVGKGEHHVMIHDAAGIYSLVQISALEIHPWNCRVRDLEHPDQIIFDLDPGPEVTWKQIVQAALLLRKVLTDAGLEPYVKTSGGKGLHLTAPIVPNVAWKQAKAFCKTIADYEAGQEDIFVANIRKDLRRGKIYIDFLRNDRTSTAVAPYSTRARAGAAVSMPVEWEQLAEIKSADFVTVKTAAGYLAKRKRDPWRDFETSRVDLLKAAGHVAAEHQKE